MTPFNINMFAKSETPSKSLTVQKVWVANPNIDRRNYPGVDWNDIAAIEKDPRFGSFVSVMALDNSDYVSAALDAGVESVNDILGFPAHIVVGASLGLFYLLLM